MWTWCEVTLGATYVLNTFEWFSYSGAQLSDWCVLKQLSNENSALAFNRKSSFQHGQFAFTTVSQVRMQTFATLRTTLHECHTRPKWLLETCRALIVHHQRGIGDASFAAFVMTMWVNPVILSVLYEVLPRPDKFSPCPKWFQDGLGIVTMDSPGVIFNQTKTTDQHSLIYHLVFVCRVWMHHKG